jgi:acyl carrier protein
MIRSEVEARVVKRIRDHLGLTEVYLDKTVDDHGADSLDREEVVAALEEEFCIEIGSEILQDGVTISDIIDLVEKNAC